MTFTSYFNDNNVGQVLDHLFNVGTQKLFSALSVSALHRFELSTDHVHFDTTSVSLYGDYRGADGDGARVGKVLAQYKMDKFIRWSIEADPANPTSREHRLIWSIDTAKVAQEKNFDGCYIISTDVDQDQMNTMEVVKAYKSLTFVERAFRNLKTVQVEVRPVYHKTDDRIRSHVCLCMLAYYLQWHMEQRLVPLFKGDGEGEQRCWTFCGVIDDLAQITRNRVSVNGAEFDQNSTPTQEPQQILNLLEVEM